MREDLIKILKIFKKEMFNNYEAIENLINSNSNQKIEIETYDGQLIILNLE